MSAADVGRVAVYAAEIAAFAGTDLESVVPLDELIARADLVTAGEWWPGPPVHVRPARRDASSSSTRCHLDGATIRIAADQATPATLAHELAHALAGSERGHDPVFRAAYLDAVAVVTNAVSTDRRHEVHVEQLAAAFSAARLSVGERRWRTPPAAGPIAL